MFWRKKKDNMFLDASVSALIAEYMDHKKSQKLADASMINIEWAMKLMDAELGCLGLGQLDAALVAAVEENLTQQDGSRYAHASHDPISKNWKGFFKWLYETKHTKIYLGCYIPTYSSVSKTSKLPSAEALAAVREAIVPYSRNTRFSALRDALVVSMIDEGGMRRKSVHELELKALIEALNNRVELFGRMMYVTTSICKGDEEVMINFGERTARLAERFLDRRGLGRSPYLFINNRNEHVAANTISYGFRRICEYAGVRPVIYSHAFRHQYITDLLLRGVNLKTIAILSNHKNEQVILKHYANISKLDALKEAAQLLNAREGSEVKG